MTKHLDQKPAGAWTYRLEFAPVSVDAKLGVIVIKDGNQELHVIDAERQPRKVSLAAFPARVENLALVAHDGPCIVATWDDGPEGRGIGIVRLDGSTIALRYALPEEIRKARADREDYEDDEELESPRVLLKAVSFDGMKLAWQEGWNLHVSTVADFVAGKAPVTFSDVDVVWAAFDERGVLYAMKGIELVTFDAKSGEQSIVDGATFAKTLVPWERGLVSAEVLVRGGEITPLDTRPWLRAINEAIEDDKNFTLDVVASHGAILCVGPAAYDDPHLCFVDLEGNLLALRKRPAKGVFWLFSLGDDLVTVGDRDKTVIVSPWPSVGA